MRSLNSPPAPGEMLALFASDMHLQESMPATTAAFLHFLQHQAVAARQLYLLGDLFEYWAGDDDIDTPFHRSVVQALRTVSDSGTAIFWIAGNRDFLLGDGFANATGATQLQDGAVIEVAGRVIVLAHGDAQCTDDVDYIAFRQQVRQPQWQADFLAQPLAQRKAMIERMREQSRTAQRDKTMQIMDVNQDAVARLFAGSGALQMIHGHTHRPANHATQIGDAQYLRVVLPDWDCEVADATARRGGWLGIRGDGVWLRFDQNARYVA